MGDGAFLRHQSGFGDSLGENGPCQGGSVGVQWGKRAESLPDSPEGTGFDDYKWYKETNMLHLVLGKAKTGKTTRLMETMARRSAKRTQVLLVPEQYSHEYERSLVRHLGNARAGRCEVLSFTRLCSRIFAETGSAREQFLDKGGRILLMHQAVQSVSAALSVYARPSRKAAFLEHLLATSDELKSCCLAPEELLSAGEEGSRLRDLGLILSAYDALTAQRARDPRDRLTRAAEALGSCGWGRDWDFYLDSFTDFTPQQQRVLEVLLRRSHSVTVALTADSLDRDGSSVRSFYRRTALSLLALARREHIDADWVVLEGRKDGASADLAALEEGLFRRSGPVHAHSPQGLRIVCAGDPYAEVEWCAGELVRLAREEGLRWREMAVAVRTMEEYGGLLETILPRYGVSVYLSQREDILQKPILTLITAALDAVQGNYEYEDVFRYLKTGLAGVSLDQVDVLENYVLRWRIRGRRWRSEEPWSAHPAGYGAAWREEDRELVQELDQLRREIIAPLERLRLTGDGTGAELAAALYGFLEEIALPEQLKRRSQALREGGRVQQAEEYRQLWDILCTALEQCAQLLGEGQLSMAQFSELFRLVLREYDVGTIPVALDRLSVGELQRMTHRQVKVLFLLGVDDAHFPMVTRQPGLLTQEDRQVLNSLGWELDEGAESLLEREQATACDGVCMPAQRLYLSWARRSGAGEECRPANLIAAARRLFPGLTLEQPDAALRYNAPLTALETAAREGREPVLDLLAQDERWRERTRLLRQVRCWRRGQLSRGSVEQLYGHRVDMSASKMDAMRSCHFAYFLNYGLKVRARRVSELDPPQVGTFVHYVLEHMLRWAGEKGGVKALDHEERRELVDRAVEQYLSEELGDLEAQPPRFRYLFRRLRRSVELIADNVAEELRQSEFEPLSFELGFGDGKTLPAVELEEGAVRLAVSGYVDRVDGWVHRDRLYLRVVDYKTGKKSFSLTDVWHGLELQMLLYLFTLEDWGKGLYGRDVVSAGVLYLPARDLILAGNRGMTEEEVRRAADKELLRTGMLLDDQEVLSAMEHLSGLQGRFLHLKRNKDKLLVGEVLASAEQWGKMRRHVEGILRSIAREIGQGRVDADPWRRGNGLDYCQWCDYRQCCHFEEEQGDRFRYLYSVKEKEFWEKTK